MRGGGGEGGRTETESGRESVVWEGKTCPPRPVPKARFSPAVYDDQGARADWL